EPTWRSPPGRRKPRRPACRPRRRRERSCASRSSPWSVVRRHLRLKRQERTIRKLYEEPVFRKGSVLWVRRPHRHSLAPVCGEFPLIIYGRSGRWSRKVIDWSILMCDTNHTGFVKPRGGVPASNWVKRDRSILDGVAGSARPALG